MPIIKKALRRGYTLLMKNLPVLASKIIYYRQFGKRLNLKNPVTFNEKLMWLKLYEDDSLKTRCADKYLVRNYLREQGYSQLLIDLHEVYEHVEQIDFRKLPNRFVMKCTHGSGFNIICQDKEKLDKKQALSQLKKWMETDYSLINCEPHYSNIKPRIIVEKFLDDEFHESLPIDYMIHCYNGEPCFIEIGLDYGDSEKKYALFTCDWNVLPFYKESVKISEIIDRPERLEEMLELSSELSKAFTYVRVDLYLCNNEIYFGELTYTPSACVETDFINNGDYLLGELLDLAGMKRGRSFIPGISKGVSVK